jgi:hypothetical protein
MDRRKEIQSAKPARRGRKIRRGDIAVFAFFLCLSFVLWYLNSLGKNLEAEIKYPVTYTNIPKDWNLDPINIPKVNISLSGSGYSILQMKLTGRRAPLIIDFTRVSYQHSQHGISGDYYIVTSNLVQGLNTQLKSSCKVTSIKPDTIFLSVK